MQAVSFLLNDAQTHQSIYDTHSKIPEIIPGGPKKTQNLCNYNGAYTSWDGISFGTFVDQHVLLLTYKFL